MSYSEGKSALHRSHKINESGMIKVLEETTSPRSLSAMTVLARFAHLAEYLWVTRMRNSLVLDLLTVETHHDHGLDLHLVVEDSHAHGLLVEAVLRAALAALGAQLVGFAQEFGWLLD